jgi:SM-20-related protein
MSEWAFALAPRTDIAALKRRFAETGRVQIRGLLDAALAHRAEAHLAHNIPWSVSMHHKDRQHDLAAATARAIDPAQRPALMADFYKEGAARFHFMFDTYRLSDLVEENRTATAFDRAFYAFLNGPALRALVVEITGEGRVGYVDAQATRYRPGHILTTHDDDVAGKNRLLAYVFNLTPVWNVDWGGLLLFLNERGDIAEGFTPAFNALNLFRVPQPHCVTMVTPSATAPRHAITGWMRASR